jgi:hypothetical protein
MSFDLRFHPPFNLMVHGISNSGKTYWVRNFLTLKHVLCSSNSSNVILFYKMMQPVYDEMVKDKLIQKAVDVSSEFPTIQEIHTMIEPYQNKGGSMIIFDDVMSELSTLKNFEQIFCNMSHHVNCSVLFLTQNLFHQAKPYRTMSLNTHYFVLMKNPRDKQQISILAKQNRPDNSNYIIQSYTDATKKNYSYLILDFSPHANDTIRLRTNIFPHESPLQVYLEK